MSIKEEIKLPSGALLKIQLAPFADARALYQAIAEELKGIKIEMDSDAFSLKKDVFCTFLASKKIEAAIWGCFPRVIYDGKKMDNDTFEPEAARDDYFMVCYHVTKANIMPFTKSLSAELGPILDLILQSPA